jgi:hypothetical protein
MVNFLKKLFFASAALFLVLGALLPVSVQAQGSCAVRMFFEEKFPDGRTSEFTDEREFKLSAARKLNLVAKAEPGCSGKEYRVVRVGQAANGPVVPVITNIPADGSYKRVAGTALFANPGRYTYILQSMESSGGKKEWLTQGDSLSINVIADTGSPAANTNTPANNVTNTATPGTTYTVGGADFDTPVGGKLRRLIDSDSVPGLLIRLMKILMVLLGTVAVIVILIGAFRMITSQGNAESIKSAKSTITWAIIGVVLALLSYSIVAILQSFLGIQ